MLTCSGYKEIANFSPRMMPKATLPKQLFSKLRSGYATGF